METDGPLKRVFASYPEHVLSLTGDVGAAVRSAGPIELSALQRRVDCVLELEKNGEIYYRHVEFQAETDADMPVRIFRYNTQLVLEYGAPVLSTVLYLYSPKPRRPPVFRIMLADREINRWTFEELSLGDFDARKTCRVAQPGLLALVPLMHGGDEEDVLVTAAARIRETLPASSSSDAEDVLMILAGRHYTYEELFRLLGRDRVIQSSLYAGGVVEGEKRLCVALIAKYHPHVLEQARPMIEACEDPARLQEWALAAPELNDSELLKLLGR